VYTAHPPSFYNRYLTDIDKTSKKQTTPAHRAHTLCAFSFGIGNITKSVWQKTVNNLVLLFFKKDVIIYLVKMHLI
jgi:hypothetical protein